MVSIRRYRDNDAGAWLRCWLMAAGWSQSWYYVHTQRPRYERSSLLLVAEDAGELVGLLDIEMENEPGDLCLQRVDSGAFAWEFAVLPARWSEGIGTRLVKKAEDTLRSRHQVRYMEWWSMDPHAQAWYSAYGMRCINEHWRFFVKPDTQSRRLSPAAAARTLHAHMTCSPEAWPAVQRELDIIDQPPLQPRLCRGYAHEF